MACAVGLVVPGCRGTKPPPEAKTQEIVHKMREAVSRSVEEKDRRERMHSGVWSISAYRENFYVHNAIERYGILSSMPLKYGADGSLEIYIQAQSPGAERESNWLPCPPSGPFNLTIRVYQPKSEMMDGHTENNLIVDASTYKIPPVERVN